MPRFNVVSSVKRLSLPLLVAGATLLHWNPSVAGESVILYGDGNYPPYSYVENGQFKGMYVELLQLAAARLRPEFDVKLRPIPWKRGLKYLETGEALALFPPGLKKERTYIQQYSLPLYAETEVVFCNDAVKLPKTPKFPDDFKGLTMGINAGFLLSQSLMDASRGGIVKIEEAYNNDSNLRKLAAQRIDCFVSDRGSALFSSKQLQKKDATYKLHLRESATLSSEDTFIGYSALANPAYKQKFITQMNSALTDLKRSGEFTKIVNSYLND